MTMSTPGFSDTPTIVSVNEDVNQFQMVTYKDFEDRAKFETVVNGGPYVYELDNQPIICFTETGGTLNSIVDPPSFVTYAGNDITINPTSPDNVGSWELKIIMTDGITERYLYLRVIVRPEVPPSPSTATQDISQCRDKLFPFSYGEGTVDMQFFDVVLDDYGNFLVTGNGKDDNPFIKLSTGYLGFIALVS